MNKQIIEKLKQINMYEEAGIYSNLPEQIEWVLRQAKLFGVEDAFSRTTLGPKFKKIILELL